MSRRIRPRGGLRETFVILRNFLGTRPLRYRLDRAVRYGIMRIIGWMAPNVESVDLDSQRSSIKKILLVRANFRMGNALLALPAIAAFRKNFPNAEIDFIGAPISQLLFRHQPLDRVYVAPRRFPRVIWQYPRLLRGLRARRYDLAVDVSCSHSGLASFIVGLCGSRIRAGIGGKWDQLFNLKIAKLAEENKYQKMIELLAAMQIPATGAVGTLMFSAGEKAEAAKTLGPIAGQRAEPAVGIFIGGRKLRGKRWPVENFVELAAALKHHDSSVVVFLGPEENDLADSLRDSLDPSIPVIYEPSVRKFAAIVAGLGLFICCDSGPMHLACAVGVRVLAIFQAGDIVRWAPPATVARTLSDQNGVEVSAVLQAALEELSHNGLTAARSFGRDHAAGAQS